MAKDRLFSGQNYSCVNSMRYPLIVAQTDSIRDIPDTGHGHWTHSLPWRAAALHCCAPTDKTTNILMCLDQLQQSRSSAKGMFSAKKCSLNADTKTSQLFTLRYLLVYSICIVAKPRSHVFREHKTL